ncbi:MAG: TlpA family protein disulfide reductase [Myxococcales bacterium]|nr:TlpA family protein disulfide reductase [Myxococcales bacterium]
MRRRRLLELFGAAWLGVGLDGCFASTKRAPDFAMRSLDGDLVSLSDFQGRVLLLHFFTTRERGSWMSLPGLATLDRKYREEGLGIVGVSVDDPKNRADVRGFVRSHNVAFPVVVDEATELSQLYNPSLIVPYGVIVTRAGAIWGYWNGFQPADLPALEAELERALEAAPLDHGETKQQSRPG